MGSRPLTRAFLLAAILIFAAGFQVLVLNRPFQFDSEGTGCFYGILARNYLRHGLSATWGVPVLSISQSPGAEAIGYHHHPPLVPLMVYASYAAFGVGEWQTRLPTAVFTVASAAALYALVARSRGRRAGLLAAAIFAATPMMLYYGGLPEVVGMPLVLFVLLTLLAYQRFCETPSPGRAAWLWAAFLAAAISDWPAFFLLPLLAGHFLFTHPRRQWHWMVALCAWGGMLFATIYLYLTLASGAPWDWMIRQFRLRSGGVPVFTAGQWLSEAWHTNASRHTVRVPVLAALWLAGWSWRQRSVVTILVAWGLVHVLVGRQGVYIHEWWWMPLTPGLAAAAAIMLDTAAEYCRQHVPERLINGMLAALLAVFAARMALTTWHERLHGEAGQPFTSVQLGRAIQAAAPGPEDIAIVVEASTHPPIWFYGDRGVKMDVWSLEDLQRRMADGIVDQAFGYQQRNPARPRGIVVPRAYAELAPQLLDYLRTNCREVETPQADKFHVYDLSGLAAHHSAGRVRSP